MSVSFFPSVCIVDKPSFSKGCEIHHLCVIKLHFAPHTLTIAYYAGFVIWTLIGLWGLISKRGTEPLVEILEHIQPFEIIC